VLHWCSGVTENEMGCEAIMASGTPGPIDNALNLERATATPVRNPKVARFAVRLCVLSVEVIV